jgi:hypothetical protein
MDRKKPLKKEDGEGEVDNLETKEKMLNRGWTGHDMSLQKKKVEKKKKNRDEVDFSKINKFLMLQMQLNMDFTNKINSFACIGMADPFETDSMSEANNHIKTLDFFSTVYPESVVRLAGEVPPKCIWLPYREMVEKIIKAVALYGRIENSEAFLLRFGLLNDQQWYLN